MPGPAPLGMAVSSDPDFWERLSRGWHGAFNALPDIGDAENSLITGATRLMHGDAAAKQQAERLQKHNLTSPVSTFGSLASGVAQHTPGAPHSSIRGDVRGAVDAGHMYHGNGAKGLIGKLMGEGGGYNLRFNPDSMKANVYDQALGVPETGFQTSIPVPDSHHSRGAGRADVMPGLKTRKDNMRSNEGAPWGNFFREKVAEPIGLEAVPSQAIMWGALSKITGVDTAVGMSKLELLAENIMRRARETGKSPEQVLSEVVRGTEFAANPASAAPLGLAPVQDR